jgi:ssDNA-binding replication factor A large subunit
MTSVDEILKSLEKQTDIPSKQLQEMVEKKHKEMAGLLSMEGAAHLVARELGVNVGISKKMGMKSIVSGMKSVNVVGRIFRISNVIEFKRSDGSPGKVVNLHISDGSSFVKLVLWDKQVKLIEDEEVKLGDVVEVSSAFAKENMYGDIELSIGKFGNIQIADADIPDVENLAKKFLSNTVQRAKISEIVPGLFEVQGAIVQIFRGNFIFNTCSICGKSMGQDGRCMEHGDVQYNPELVVSVVVDDSSDDMRIVFFRELAEKLIGTTAGELAELDQEKRYELVKGKLLGRELTISGRVKKNKMFDRLEMMANDFKEINATEEGKKLIDTILLKIGEESGE